MKKGFLALAISTLVGFSAQAGMEDYAGSYSGKFERTKGSIIITVNGGTMSAAFVGANGTSDILGGNCGSTIGAMTDIDMDGSKVDYVRFAFNPGSCGLDYQGRDLTIDFDHDDGVLEGFAASLYKETTYTNDWQCWPNPYPPGGSSCTPQTQAMDWYATGSFKK